MTAERSILHLITADAEKRHSIAAIFSDTGIDVESHLGPRGYLSRRDPDADGCVVLDVDKAGDCSLEGFNELVAGGSWLPVVVVSTVASVEAAVAAMKKGADDFLVLPDGLSRLRARVVELIEKLTARESEILPFLMEGRSSKEIGRALDISHRTVEVHRSNILRKLGLSSVFQLSHDPHYAGVSGQA